jgi:hypothetical protein
MMMTTTTTIMMTILSLLMQCFSHPCGHGISCTRRDPKHLAAFHHPPPPGLPVCLRKCDKITQGPSRDVKHIVEHQHPCPFRRACQTLHNKKLSLADRQAHMRNWSHPCEHNLSCPALLDEEWSWEHMRYFTHPPRKQGVAPSSGHALNGSSGSAAGEGDGDSVGLRHGLDLDDDDMLSQAMSTEGEVDVGVGLYDFDDMEYAMDDGPVTNLDLTAAERASLAIIEGVGGSQPDDDLGMHGDGEGGWEPFVNTEVETPRAP